MLPIDRTNDQMSEAKTNCRNCGVEILAGTASLNHGLCTPCRRKRGEYEYQKYTGGWRKTFGVKGLSCVVPGTLDAIDPVAEDLAEVICTDAPFYISEAIKHLMEYLDLEKRPKDSWTPCEIRFAEGGVSFSVVFENDRDLDAFWSVQFYGSVLQGFCPLGFKREFR